MASRKVLTGEVQDLGNTIETPLTVASVGKNGVKRVVGALLRLTTTDRAGERILTIHTRLLARCQDRLPAFKFLQTFIVDEIKGIAEAGCPRLRQGYSGRIPETVGPLGEGMGKGLPIAMVVNLAPAQNHSGTELTFEHADRVREDSLQPRVSVLRPRTSRFGRFFLGAELLP